MKKMFVKIKESVEEKLRKLCSGLSPEKRVPSMTSDGRMYGRKS